MIRSMTAFASADRQTPWGTLGCELRAVNHRYLELSVRAPEELRVLEPALRERIGAKVQRGKLELSLRLRAAPDAASATLRLNEPLLDQLAAASRTFGPRFPGLTVDFATLLALPGVVQQDGIDSAGLQGEALALAEETIAEFLRAREREGEMLAATLRERLAGVEAACAQVRQWLPEIRAGLRTRLEARFAELAPALDPGRLEQEFVLWLQKLDVDEELDRLATHIAEARRVLGLREAVGRRLDFLMQEFNREANTLGSKSVDARTSQVAVELKVLIEQMREQVQNLE
ncbi:MAG TPA: YicC family protein [Chiayiivirga sp.]|nr:YicC family protein [Chiayiivirga sp.]